MMPGYFTDYVNNHLMDFLFGNVAFLPPSTLYIGLSLGPANKAGTVIEPGAGYSRVAVENSIANFPAAVAGSKSNDCTITFPSPTAPWGTILSAFIADAANGGDVLAVADLTVPQSINPGTAAPAIAVGALFVGRS